jgi:hypothetical protein
VKLPARDINWRRDRPRACGWSGRMQRDNRTIKGDGPKQNQEDTVVMFDMQNRKLGPYWATITKRILTSVMDGRYPCTAEMAS